MVVVRCEGINISGNFYRNKRELGENAGFWGEIPGFWGEFQRFRVSEKLQEVSRSSRVLDAPPNPLN